MQVVFPSSRFDLLRLPLAGRFLLWRHARASAQALVLLVAGFVVIDGLFGPQLAPKNLAGVLPWVQWRGLVVLSLLLLGNVFCFACPFMLVRRAAKRLFAADRPWPSRLRGKWLAVFLLVLFFWSYEALDLWASPLLTAWLVVLYFLAVFVVDATFRGAAFCKYLCPIGHFHFVNSMVSPFEVAVRNPRVCAGCRGKECIAGGRGPRRGLPGCELWLFQPGKAGNMDCTFCLDCARACSYDNVGVVARLPTVELWTDPQRAGIGRLGRRTDVAALATVLVFAAFANAFGMVSPVYALEAAIATALRTNVEGLVLAVLFGAMLVVLPAAAISVAATASRAASGTTMPLTLLAARYVYGLVPVGFGMWLAHYAYHFMIGALTIVPVAQSVLKDFGWPLLGEPAWGMGAVVPAGWLVPIELVFLEAGLLGSLLALYRIASDVEGDRSRAWRAFAPWAVLAGLLFSAGVWLMLQPMEMRGTFGAG